MNIGEFYEKAWAEVRELAEEVENLEKSLQDARTRLNFAMREQSRLEGLLRGTGVIFRLRLRFGAGTRFGRDPEEALNNAKQKGWIPEGAALVRTIPNNNFPQLAEYLFVLPAKSE